jgi:hypothetical protein
MEQHLLPADQMENERNLRVRILYNENYHIAQNNADDEQIPYNENN